MNILYISTSMDEDLIAKIKLKNSNYSIAAIKYADLIRKGLENNKSIVLTNVFSPTFTTWPHVKTFLFFNRRQLSGKYISFINLPFLKQFTMSFSVFVKTLGWVLKNKRKEKNIIILSSIQLPFLLGTFFLKLWGVKIVSFVPDLPQYQYGYTRDRNIIRRFFTPLYIKICNIFIYAIDYYVFITKQMVTLFPHRPFTIMEGLVDLNDSSSIECPEEHAFIVMYAGSLHETMGIRLLLDAFEQMEENMELWIFGTGDLQSLVEEKAKICKKIKYYGRVSNNDIIRYEQKVDLLINPRFSSQEFTKYSFPSKLMEYMLSGTPVLTTRLPGISEEYNDLMYFIEDETVEGVRKSIIECYRKKPEEFQRRGRDTKKYVLENKNCNVQIDRIINHIVQNL